MENKGTTIFLILLVKSKIFTIHKVIGGIYREPLHQVLFFFTTLMTCYQKNHYLCISQKQDYPRPLLVQSILCISPSCATLT